MGIEANSSPMKNMMKWPLEIIKYIPSTVKSVSGVLIHSAKGLSRCGTSRTPGHEIDDSVNEHQQHGEDSAEMATTTAHCTCAVGSAGQSALFFAAYEEVGKKQDDDDGEKAKLLGHTKELTIIHSLMSFYKLEERIAL